MNFLFITTIIFLGLITSYEDFKLGKIRNQWIILGLIVGLLLWSYFFIFTELVNLSYIFQILINFLFATLAAFLMWRIKSWSAGDAKMFIVYSFLFPFSFYSNTYLKFFPSFIILFNTFILVLSYLFFRSCLFNAGKIYKKIIRRECLYNNWHGKSKSAYIYLQGLAKFLPSFLLFMLLLSFSYPYVNNLWPINFFLFQILAVCILIIFTKPLTELYQKKYTNLISFLFFLGLLSLGFYYEYSYTMVVATNLFVMIFIFMIIFPIFNKIINSYLDQVRGKILHYSELSPGMILRQNTVRLLDLRNEINYSFSGLTIEEVDIVKINAEEKNIENVEIGIPFYFGLWLFFGVVITLIIKGSILSFVSGF